MAKAAKPPMKKGGKPAKPAKGGFPFPPKKKDC